MAIDYNKLMEKAKAKDKEVEETLKNAGVEGRTGFTSTGFTTTNKIGEQPKPRVTEEPIARDESIAKKPISNWINEYIGRLPGLTATPKETGIPTRIRATAGESFAPENKSVIDSYYDRRNGMPGVNKPQAFNFPLNLNNMPQAKMDNTVKNTILAKASKEEPISLVDLVHERNNAQQNQFIQNDTLQNQENQDNQDNQSKGFLSKNLWAGASGIDSAVMSTLDWILPNELAGKYDFLEPVFNYYRKDAANRQAEADTVNDTQVKKVAGQLIQGTVQAIPSALLAMASGGSSLLGQGQTVLQGVTNANKVNKIGTALQGAVKELGKNPMFWTSFLQMAGPTYEQEIENGANEAQASASAMLNGILGSAIEVSGGLETFKWADKGWKALLKTALEEGGEEVSQYSLQNLINKAIGSDTAKWYSGDINQEAVINPLAMAEQGAYGAAIGGILGGGQQLAVRGINKGAEIINERNQTERIPIVDVNGKIKYQTVPKTEKIKNDGAIFTKLGLEEDYTPDNVAKMNEELLNKFEEAFTTIGQIESGILTLDDETVSRLNDINEILQDAANNNFVVSGAKPVYKDISNKIEEAIANRKPESGTPTIDTTTINVGKRQGSNLTVHKGIGDTIPTVSQAKAKAGDIDYDIVKVNEKNGTVTFVKVDDFDGKTEPKVISETTVTADGTVNVVTPENKVIVDKASYVPDDYTGFNVEQAKAREREWRDAKKHGSYNPRRIEEEDYFNERAKTVFGETNKTDTLDETDYYNQEGKEITLYHGSSKKFDINDISKSKAQAGEGIFLTDSIDEAKEFGEYIYTVKIKPGKIATFKEWQMAYDQLQEEYSQKFNNLEAAFEKGLISYDDYENELDKLNSEWTADEVSDLEQNAKVSRLLKEQGYDLYIGNLQSGNEGNEYLVLDESIIIKDRISPDGQTLDNTTETASTETQEPRNDIETNSKVPTDGYLDKNGVIIKDTINIQHLDYSIADIIENLNQAGYKSIASCSGLEKDHTKGVFHSHAYIGFLKSQNSRENLDKIENVAKSLDMSVEHSDIYFSPSLIVRIDKDKKGMSSEDRTRKANEVADSHFGKEFAKDNYTTEEMEEWVTIRSKESQRILNENGGLLYDTDEEVETAWKKFEAGLLKASEQKSEIKSEPIEETKPVEKEPKKIDNKDANIPTDLFDSIVSDIFDKETVSSKGTKDSIRTALNNVYSNFNNLDYCYDILVNTIKDITVTGTLNEGASNEAKELIKAVRNAKIKITDEIRQGIPDFEAYRRKNIGVVRLTKDGSNIDTFYAELADLYPEYFDSEISHPVDQLEAIVNVVNSIREKKNYKLSDWLSDLDITQYYVMPILEAINNYKKGDVTSERQPKGTVETDNSHSAGDERKTPESIGQGEKEIGTVKGEDKQTPKQIIASKIIEKLEKKEKFSSQDLFNIANEAFGGTQAESVYDVKTAYDAMELGVNHYLLVHANEYEADTAEQALKNIDDLSELISLLPTQGAKRNETMEKYQQFSTPPTIAYLADYVANASYNDTILEPSAGIGGLVAMPKGWGATVYVNELEKGRFDTIQNMPFDGFFNENAEQINNVLPEDIKPTLVIMNPPFSTAAERFGNKRNTNFATRHIEQALLRLEDNGRLVAIVGRGMSEDATSFKEWWKEIKGKYNVKANIQIAGENYKKYGTTFDIQLVVIDKTGKTEEPTITGVYENLSDALNVLEGIRNERPRIEKVESDTTVKTSGDSTRGGSRRDGSVSSTGTGKGTVNVSDNNQQSGPSANGTDSQRDSGIRDSEAKPEEDLPVDDRIDRGERDTESAERDGDSRGQTGASNDTDRRESGRKPIEQLETVEKNSAKNDIIETEDDVYNVYKSKKLKIKNAQKHPTDLVESAAMSAVESPELTYIPSLDKSLIEKGVVSEAQLEAISYAGQAHETIFPDGRRQGFFIGDGTGVGKGREICGIILDNFNQGRKKAVWISKNADLFKDAIRDWTDLGNNKDDIFNLSKTKAELSINKKDGILFTTYDTLKSKSKNIPTKTRLKQIVEWLGPDFDGVIIFDESHNMGNSQDTGKGFNKKKAAQKALAGVDFQEALPNARIVYASATGATEVDNLAYLTRLGLWGANTAFHNVNEFISKVGAGGLAAMELVARDMKSLGLYLARNLSFKGVEYDTLEHELTPIQEAIYDEMSKAWQLVFKNIEETMKLTNANLNGDAKRNAKGQFYGALQRFYNQVITSMSVPSVIEDIKKELANGNSCVIQLVNTNEAAQERSISKTEQEGLSLDDIDMTPSEMLINYLMKSFPIYEYEEYEDEKGNKRSQLVTDSEGKPVISREAVKKRDALVEHVKQLKVPEGPLEMIINEFGSDAVAEITGRDRRVVEKNGKKVIEKLTDKIKAADEIAFQNGEKRILIFSDAGGTGRSYHASRSVKNQQRRIHYLLQPGWNASNAVQGFGRTHRSNQAVAPLFRLVTTNISGQKRFTSTIAKRLDQLGALTKGQRETGSGIFSAKDNLENMIAKDALVLFYRKLARNVYDLDGESVIKKMGLYDKLFNKNGVYSEDPDVVRDTSLFLNRILAIEVQEQNKVFEYFSNEIEEVFNAAKEAGMVDMGTENYIAEKINIAEEITIRKDTNTGAETKYMRVVSSKKTTIIDFDSLPFFYKSKFVGLVRLKNTDEVRAVYQLPNKTLNTGEVSKCYRLVSPVAENSTSTYIQSTMDEKTEPIPKKEWKAEWNKQIQKSPEYIDETMHMITGVLLPVWDRLPEEMPKVRRVMDRKGSIQLLGRIIPVNQIDGVLFSFNARRQREVYTSEQIYDKVMSGNDIVLRANKQRIVKRRVSGENRIEITGDNVWFYNSISGVFSEKINGQYRYFIPTDKAKAKAIIDRIVLANEVVDVIKSNKSIGEQEFNSAVEIKPANSDIKSMVGNFYTPVNPMAYQTSVIFKTRDGELKPIGDIIRKLSKDFKVPITSVRFRRRNKLGVYNTKYKQIETKYYNTIGVVSHELGHHLDDKYDLQDGFKQELKALSQKLNAEVKAKYKEHELPGEAIAEFVRLYLTDPYGAYEFGYISDTRNFYDLFESALLESDKRILENARADILNWLGADIQDKIKSTIVKYDKKEPIIERIKNLTSKDFRYRFYMKFVNAFEPLKTVDDAIKSLTGKEIKPSESAELKAYQTLRSDVIADFIALGRLVSPKGEIIGDSFKTILEPITKGQFDDFDAYLKMVHSLDWREQGKQVFSKDISFDEIELAIQRYEAQYPHFKDTAQNLYDWWNNFTRTWLVDTGIMETEVYEMLREMYPHYVPNFRATSTLEWGIKRAKSGFSNQTNPMRRASEKGNDMDTYSATQSMIMEIERYVKTVLRRDVMLTLHKNYQNEDYAEVMGGFMRKVAPEMQRSVFNAIQTKVNLSGDLFREEYDKMTKQEQEEFDKKPILEQIKIMQKLGKVDLIDGVIDDYIVFYTPKKISTDSRIVTVVDKGHTYFYEIVDYDGFGELLLEAIQNVEPKQLNKVMKVLASIKRTMTILTTGGNPIFGLTSNFWRDIQQAYILGSYNNPFTFAREIAKAFRSIYRQDDIYLKYKSIGGGYESPIGADANYIRKTMRKLIPDERVGVKNKIGMAIDAIEAFNNLIETAPRLMEFKHFYEQGGDSYDSLLKAGYRAADVTLNFSRHGSFNELGTIIPFFNAGVQGLDKLYRSGVRDKAEFKTRFIKALTLISLLSIAQALAYSDDDDYDVLPDFYKDNYWLIKYDKGKFIRIPKPRELGVLFGATFDRGIKEMLNSEDDNGEALLTAFAQNFSVPVRWVLAPLYDVSANKSWSGSPIISTRDELLSIDGYYKEQYDDTTSLLAIGLSKLVPGILGPYSSPKNIDYLLKQYTGGLGQIVLPMTTPNSEGVVEGIRRKVTVDTTYSNRYVDEFWDIYSKLQAAKYISDTKGKKTEDYNDQWRLAFQRINNGFKDIDNLKEPKLPNELRKLLKNGGFEGLSKMRRRIKDIQSDDKLSSEEKKKQIEEIKDEINNISKILVKEYNKATKK